MSTKLYFDSGLDFMPTDELKAWGFRLGQRGAHTSRTMMYDDLALLLAIPGEPPLHEYKHAIREENWLHKATANARKVAYQRLRELYSLDGETVLFGAMRKAWRHVEAQQKQLALSLALARDPLLRATARVVHATPIGEELDKDALAEAVGAFMACKINERSVGNTTRNIAATWTQAGYLVGRKRKVRARTEATAASFAFALLLGYAAGYRHRALLSSPWVRVLDVADPGSAELLADEAKRLGYIDLKKCGDLVEVDPRRLLDDDARARISAV